MVRSVQTLQSIPNTDFDLRVVFSLSYLQKTPDIALVGSTPAFALFRDDSLLSVMADAFQSHSGTVHQENWRVLR